ncbi:MAG: hypothetical protein LKH24_08335, partial [Solobacterium sp.]|nr:hypothetical protein [Solobacterium sp.]
SKAQPDSLCPKKTCHRALSSSPQVLVLCKRQNQKKSPGSIDFLVLPGLAIFTGCQRPDSIILRVMGG